MVKIAYGIEASAFQSSNLIGWVRGYLAAFPGSCAHKSLGTRLGVIIFICQKLEKIRAMTRSINIYWGLISSSSPSLSLEVAI